MSAKVARLRAWVLVALKIRRNFSRRLLQFRTVIYVVGDGKRTTQNGRERPSCKLCQSTVSHPKDEGYIHKGVWKANFGPVNGTIAGCLKKTKELSILGIQYDAVHSLLLVNQHEEPKTKLNCGEADLHGFHDHQIASTHGMHHRPKTDRYFGLGCIIATDTGSRILMLGVKAAQR